MRGARAWRAVVRAGLAAVPLATLILGVACGAAAPVDRVEGAAGAHLLVDDGGCATAALEVSADAPSEFTAENEADRPMVVTVPKQALSVRLEPGETQTVSLNPHLRGTFDYYCIDEPTHVALGGHEGEGLLACPLDPPSLDAAGASRGSLHLAPHA